MEKTESVAAKPKRGLKLSDIFVVVVFLLICVFLLDALLGQLSLKHEVSAAKEVTNRTITDIAKDNAVDARSLGTSTFQKANATTVLSGNFKTIQSHTHGTPIIDKQTVTNDKTGQEVSVIYKYPGKPVVYIRVITAKLTGQTKWQLVSISGNNSEAALLKN